MTTPGPDHPIHIRPAARRWRALFAGHVIADSDDALVLQEGARPEVIYFPREDVSSYGVIAPGAHVSDALTEVTGLVEKPTIEQAPSNKIISGRYILQPEVMRTLEDQEKGAGGEIQLTDAMARMIGSQPFHAVTFAGRRFDCGSKTGFVEATLALALEREDIGAEVREAARRLLG